LNPAAADFAGTVVDGQKVCTSGGYKFQIYYGKLFENTGNSAIYNSLNS